MRYLAVMASDHVVTCALNSPGNDDESAATAATLTGVVTGFGTELGPEFGTWTSSRIVDEDEDEGEDDEDAEPSMSSLCFMNPTKVTTMKSMRLIPAGRISRNARRERDTMPSLARRYRASGVNV